MTLPTPRRRKRGVHHGVNELRARLACSPLRTAPAVHCCSPAAAAAAAAAAEPRPQRNGQQHRNHGGRLSRLHEAPMLDVFAFLSARDLAHLEMTCTLVRYPFVGGKGICEYVASLRLDKLPRRCDPETLRGPIFRLHLATSRVFLTVLRRRGATASNFANIRSAAAIARSIVAPPASRTTGLQVMSEMDLAAGVDIVDGVFADAGLLAAETEVMLVPLKEARRLGLRTRVLDAALALGECVVDAVPESLRSKLDDDGCWVLRRVDGSPCWSPEAFEARLQKSSDGAERVAPTRRTKPPIAEAKPHPLDLEPSEAKLLVRQHLEAAAAEHAASRDRSSSRGKLRKTSAEPVLRLEFEHAYERRDIALPLGVSAAAAVDAAKRAFGVAAASAALFTTGSSSAQTGRAACWTDADRRTTLASSGLHAGDHVTFLFCVLPRRF